MPDKKLNLTGANKILSGESPNLNLDAASAILKKKVVSESGGYGSQLGSQSFQPTKAYVPTPLIGQGAKEYKAPSKQKVAIEPEVSYGQNLEAMFASGVDQLGRMVSSIPSGLLDLSIQAFGTPALKASMDAEMLGKLAEKQLGVKESYNPFSPNNYLANLYKERGKAAQAATNLKYGGSVSDAVSNGDYAEAGKLLSLNVAQALPVMVGLVASRGAGAGEAASLIGLGVGTQATTYEDLKQQYPDIDKNTLLTNSILTGLGEAGSELIGTSLLYNQGRKLLAKGAKKEAEDLIKGGVKSYLDNAFKKAFVGSAVISDASGEMANQVWKNFVDKETVDPNRELLDGVLDAGIVSLGMTGPVAGGIKVADRVLNPVAKQTITDNSNKIQEINKELDNPEVNTTTKALLLNQVSDLTEKVNDAIDEDNNIYKSLDEGQKEEVNRIADEIEGLTESLQSSNISEPTKELLKGQIETLNTQLQNAIQKPSTTSQVPPVIEGGQNLQEGGEGVGQGEQGIEVAKETPIKESTATVKPKEKVNTETDFSGEKTIKLQEGIDDLEDELIKYYMSKYNIDEDAALEKALFEPIESDFKYKNELDYAIEQRNQLYDNTTKEISNEIDRVGKELGFSEDVIERFKDKIYIDKFGKSTITDFNTNFIDRLSDDKMKSIAEAIAIVDLDEKGLDYEGVMGNNSGWSKQEKENYIKDIANKAQLIKEAIINRASKGDIATEAPQKVIAQEEVATAELTTVKDEVVNARGKENKTNALARLKDVATEEEFQTFLDENPRFNKYVEGGTEQKKLGASRIVGEAIKPEEFTEFEEVTNEDAEAMLRDSIETPFRNKEKLDKTSKSLVSRIIRAAFDSQYEVIQKLLKQGGDIGKITVAALKNRKGYNGKASIINRLFNKEIFKDLSLAPNIDVAGRKTSERELFDTVLNLNRIINIDARISDKFAQLVQVDRKIKEGIKNKSLNKEQLAELTKEKEILEDYLDNRKALRTVNGEYVPVQYLHSGGRTAASARAELAVLKSAIPDVYEKLNKSYDAYTDAFRFLLDEQFNNGMISKSVYDELFSYNYIPTKYIQHFIENELSQDNPVLASKLSSTIKNLTGGSDSDVITNFQAILELYTNSVYKRIYENRAAKSLAKSVRDTGEQSKSLMKTNQLVKDADAKLSKQPMYNVNLDMYIQEPTGEDKFGNPTYGDVPTGYDVIYFYDANGKRERVVASKDFVDTWYDRGGLLSPKGEEYLSGISKWSGVNLFKSLITKNNPAFGIYQILQDAPQALIATKAYPDFILGSFQLASDYATVSKDIIKFVKNDEVTPLFKEAIDAGIFSDFLSTENDILRSQTLVNSDGSTNYKTTAKALKNRIGKAVNSTLDSIAQTNEAIEYLTRLAVYKRMKQNLVAKYTKENGGVEPTENQMFDIQQLAAQEARNVVDFSRSGTIIKPLNKVFAYLNAGIQAFYSSARSLKNNPTKAAVLLTEIGIGGVAVMAMSLGAYGDDKEKKKRLAKYMMLSKYQKANYFNIYNPYTDDPEMEWIRIPKPQPFRGFINLLEQGYLHNVMDVDINMKQAQEAFSNDVPLEPSLLDLLTRNPLINATVKYSMNKDVFRNQDVVKNAEKIEDWAEGIDDENVSKLYKQLGKSTKDLLGGEGISPKRAQAFSQSLIGDPSRNTTTAVLDKFGKSLFYIINGDEKGLDEEFGDRTVADNIFKLTGLKGRLFSKTPKMDASFMEGLDEQRRELFTKRLLIRSEIEDIYNTADSKQEATKLVNERLNELVKNKDITPQYKKKIIASESKKDILKDKPSWYKSLLYSESNDEKVQILKHYTEGMSNDEYKKAAMFLLQNKIISPEVTKEFAIVRNKK